ncbi:packaged DNA stabilization gp4 family protein [Pseudomonas sp.]|uniref:packaged DNA stabilization gp4 family protein n=1 Tax=Pseudomonas sp. TaxID=306 RepID=UPI003FD7111A
MSFTKRQIVEAAYGEVALAAYTFDLSPDEIQAGLARIESMLRSWLTLGIDTGYVLPNTPAVSDPDDDSAMLDMYDEAVRTNGAIRIAPLFGKTVSAESRLAAALAYQAMLVQRKIPSMQLPRTLPVGAGNRIYGLGWRNFFRPCLPAGVVDPSITFCSTDDEIVP